MRSSLLAIAALAGALSLTSAASAADLIIDEATVAPAAVSEAGTIYLKVYGGASLENTLEWEGTDYDLDAGWLIGAAIGTEVFAPGLSVELDATASHAVYTGETNDLNSVALMANLVYTAPIADAVSIYFGAGAGVIGVQYADYDYGYGAGGQVFAGLSLDLTDNVALFGEARYQTAFGTIDADGYDVEFGRASVLAGLKFSF